MSLRVIFTQVSQTHSNRETDRQVNRWMVGRLDKLALRQIATQNDIPTDRK
jgi:hypothetical protein